MNDNRELKYAGISCADEPITQIRRLRLPYPPALNSLYRSHGKSWYLSKSAKDFKWDVAILVKRANIEPFARCDDLYLSVHLHPPDKRKRDIDGVAKILFDSLQDCGLIPNDVQIKRLYLEMHPYSGESYVEVSIHPLRYG